jgi:hypothetical protein
MRDDGAPVRPGAGTPRPMSKASELAKQNGAQLADTIRASGQMLDRTNRPDRRLHPTHASEPQINPCNAGAIHRGHWKVVFRMAAIGRLLNVRS